VNDSARISLRPIANPLPLGFLALAGATLVVAGLQLGWVPESDGHDVALILIGFVAPLQLVVSIFGFLARDVAAATAMGLLAGVWLSVGLVTLTGPPGSTSDALGLFLLLAAAAMLVPAVTAAGSKLMPAIVLTTTALRFAVTGVYELNASSGWKNVAGIVGLALCALALYTALAMALEDARRPTPLWLGRRQAFDGHGIELEAGIREQL
jgi:succinate-acetate transporter protein